MYFAVRNHMRWRHRARLTLRLKPRCAAVLRRVWEMLPARWASWVHYRVMLATAVLPPPLASRVRLLAARVRAPNAGIEHDYPTWIRLYDRTDDRARREAMARIAQLQDPPLISILMPVFNPQPDDLRAAIRSVEDQFYPGWELCIADDASTDPRIAGIVREAQSRDRRIKIVLRQANGHISAASNSALALATGSFIALLDHDDTLAPHALYEIACAILARPQADIVYSDEDKIDRNGRRSDPYFKTAWDPELMLGHNMICHLGVFRRTVVQQVGGFRPGLEGSQDYDLALRVAAASAPDRIVHVPKILYHWRKRAERSSFSDTALDQCAANGRRAVSDFLSGEPPGIRVVPAPASPAWNRIVYPVPEPEPLVSVIIPSRNQADLLAQTMRGLLENSDYPALEVLIVDNGSDEPDALTTLAKLASNPRVRVIHAPGPFNYSALNNRAIQEAAGSLVLLMNNDISVIRSDWLREMVSHAARPGIGAVGAKLLYPDGRVQHGGVTLGVGGVAGHQYLRWPRDDLGYFGHLVLARNVMAVTGACLMVRRDAFLEVGGLDETNLPVAFNDIDFCLKLIERGYRNVWTPYAELYHHESASRGLDLLGEKAARFKRECDYMCRRWKDTLVNDPYWNPNLSLFPAELALAFPPREQTATNHDMRLITAAAVTAHRAD